MTITSLDETRTLKNRQTRFFKVRVSDFSFKGNFVNSTRFRFQSQRKKRRIAAFVLRTSKNSFCLFCCSATFSSSPFLSRIKMTNTEILSFSYVRRWNQQHSDMFALHRHLLVLHVGLCSSISEPDFCAFRLKHISKLLLEERFQVSSLSRASSEQRRSPLN